MADWKPSFYDSATLWGMNFMSTFTGALRQTPDKNRRVRTGALSYIDFTVENYKSIKKPVTIPLTEGRLVALLGLNESGKTTVLKALESFDYRNDPKEQSSVKRMFERILNKQDIFSNKSAKITASIKIDTKIDPALFWESAKEKLQEKSGQQPVQETDVHSFFRLLNKGEKIRISRIIPFEDGKPQPTFYRIEDMDALDGGSSVSALASSEDFVSLCATYIVSLCPYIIYFEDFQDIVPEKIHVAPDSASFNQDWYDIIEGVFYDTDPDYSIDKFIELYQEQNLRTTAAKTMLEKINKNLDKKFTRQWKNLSEVKHMGSTKLDYAPEEKCFRILIGDKDGTMYDVQERSRGAIWYVSFLMKTEFRRKKMRRDVGKLIYLIDEPASNLHSSAQENMLDDFGKLVRDTCVIYTTHSKYLVSLGNIRTTYVLRKERGGALSCIKLGRYMESPESKESYYRPVADHLMIRPHSLDMPYKKSLIVEGPSDMTILRVMCKIAAGRTPDFAIYPAGGSGNMECLISFNLGWGANMKILLDSDRSGNEAKEKYQKQFALEDSHFVSLPGGASKIEKLFDDETVKALWKSCQGDSIDKPNKKHIAQIFARANLEGAVHTAVSKKLDKGTKDKFKVFFEKTLSGFSD